MSDQQQNPYGQQQFGTPGPYGQQYDQQYGAHDGREYGDGAYGGYPQDAYAQPHDAYAQPQDPYADPYAQPQAPYAQAQPRTQTWEGDTWQTDAGLPAHAAATAETAQLSGRHAAPQAAALHEPAPQAAAEPPEDLSRLAPNQRARALGHSPIIPPGFQPAALTAGLAVLLALAAPLPRVFPAVVVAVLQAVTAAGWFRLNGMWPARQGIALAFLGGLVTDVALLATARDDAPVVGIGTLGVWCLLVLVLQLRNRSSADERMYALTAGLTSSALAVLAAGHLAAEPHATVTGAAAVAVAVLARALPLPGPVSVVLALLAATGAGIAAGQLGGYGTAGAVLGFAAGGCALIGLRVASYDYPSRFVHLTAGVALPLALAAPAVYVLGRALS
ncbi:hypothetical protein [Streptomyces purpurogeneiscleroticus]|uniref:hypothetical protein n=1 Tax=Streptomyces purpurogeneiscleroticus TaxID=68259 RepID=UPI001CBCB4CA|nr:hypothetical protein [Streptomyces purpurogeneiscleroticus]MBZ4020384.1 hypothetical protein [Streptomyces purpurogeneiscleroticus]